MEYNGQLQYHSVFDASVRHISSAAIAAPAAAVADSQDAIHWDYRLISAAAAAAVCVPYSSGRLTDIRPTTDLTSAQDTGWTRTTNISVVEVVWL